MYATTQSGGDGGGFKFCQIIYVENYTNTLKVGSVDRLDSHKGFGSFKVLLYR